MFGKGKFPVVALTMRLSLGRINAVIIATAILHNICRINNLPDIPPEVEIPAANIIPIAINAEEVHQTERANLIANYFDK